jgi:hypothetical protein
MKDAEEQKRSSVTQYSSLRLFSEGSQQNKSLNLSKSTGGKVAETQYTSFTTKPPVPCAMNIMGVSKRG